MRIDTATPAIPARLLIHSCELYKQDTASRYGDAYAKAPITIEHVRCDYGIEKIDKTWADDTSVSAVLFIDCRNSSPFVIPEARDKIVINGSQTFVKSVKQLYGIDGLHHVEVALTNE